MRHIFLAAAFCVMTLLTLSYAATHDAVTAQTAGTAIVSTDGVAADPLSDGFGRPPQSSHPWVYWFVMDGNLNREGITADLEAMKRVGIAGVIFMEADLGMPKGPVKFMSPQWRELFKFANEEAARLGLVITMAAAPGWTGSGGPWVKPEQSMQKLVSSEMNLTGPKRFEGTLPQPPITAGFYRDVAVLAFETPESDYRIADINQKAVYRRGEFPSKGKIPSLAALTSKQVISKEHIIDLTGKMDANGKLIWDVPAGKWTLLRFGDTSTGKLTSPAPEAGLGFECDKLDKAALQSHFDNFLGKLITDIGPLTGKSLVALHIDSWEAGMQNWTEKFPAEFRKRRGYDLTRYLPVMTGRVVDSLDVSERFLWDLRQTITELITENQAGALAELAHRHGLMLSIEPYTGPFDDMTYGGPADVPMGEFWKDTFNTRDTCTEAVSVAHVYGRPIVGAEAFTCNFDSLVCPASLKSLGDWAFCEGINRLVIHRYIHQPPQYGSPGLMMKNIGIHYERTQTWWEQSKAWIDYLTRCQFLLQQGLFVADICYLSPEASPHQFAAPPSALHGKPPHRLGYNFDGCTAEALLTRMSVRDGRLVLPDGMSYRILVLPNVPTMTPQLLRKISELVAAGATVVGEPPAKSPSLSDYPDCDRQVKKLAGELWGKVAVDGNERAFGKGRIIAIRPQGDANIYPNYAVVSDVLSKMGVLPDFESDNDLSYIHRHDGNADIYFVSNSQSAAIKANCTFRVSGKLPEIWDAVIGKMRAAAAFKQADGRTTLPLEFDASGSVFVIFRKHTDITQADGRNFAEFKTVQEIKGPWTVSFDPNWGGPKSVVFDFLTDWSTSADAGIKYYSGTAVYTKTFNITPAKSQRLYLDLGQVEVMAQVKLNEKDLGIAWTTPYRLDITDAIKDGPNMLEIAVVNLWVNRLIGDQSLPENKRYTHSTWNPPKRDDKVPLSLLFPVNLIPSGLLGPVTLKALPCKNSSDR